MSRQPDTHRSSGSQRNDDYANNARQRNRSRSRSRSTDSSSSSSSSPPPRRSSSPGLKRTEHQQNRDRDQHRRQSDHRTNAPTQPQISSARPSFSFGRVGGMAPPTNKILPVQMKLSSSKPKNEPTKKITVASAFCNESDEDDDDVEEMPAECRMRMRNIGRDTPTSSGPNSFGKTKQGFCDSQKIIEKNLKGGNKK